MITTTLSAWTEALGWTLLHSLWQFVLIAALARAIHSLFKLKANGQYRIYYLSMLALVACCILTFQWVYETPEAINTSIVQMVNPTESQIDNNTITAIQVAPNIQGNLHWTDQFWSLSMEFIQSNIHWISILWILGVVMCSFRFLLGYYQLQRMRTDQVVHLSSFDPAQYRFWRLRFREMCQRYQLPSSVQLLFSERINEPVSFGHFRPVILFPLGLVNNLTTEQVEMILMHELAHIKRYDYLFNLLQTSIEVLFFYHPAMWWLSRQVRSAREHCCDDWVITQRQNRMAYAQTLTAVQQYNFSPQNQLAMSAKGIKGMFTARIKRLFEPQESFSLWSSLLPIFIFGSVLLGSVSLNFAKAQNNPKATKLETEEMKLKKMEIEMKELVVKLENEAKQELIKTYNRLNPETFPTSEEVLKPYIILQSTDAEGNEIGVQINVVKGTDSFKPKSLRVTDLEGSGPMIIYDGKPLDMEKETIDIIAKNNIEDFALLSSEDALESYGKEGAEKGVLLITLRKSQTPTSDEEGKLIADFYNAVEFDPSLKTQKLLRRYFMHQPVDKFGNELQVQFDILTRASRNNPKILRVFFPEGDDAIIVYGENEINVVKNKAIDFFITKEIKDIKIWSTKKALDELGQDAADRKVVQIIVEEEQKAKPKQAITSTYSDHTTIAEKIKKIEKEGKKYTSLGTSEIPYGHTEPIHVLVEVFPHLTFEGRKTIRVKSLKNTKPWVVFNDFDHIYNSPYYDFVTYDKIISFGFVQNPDRILSLGQNSDNPAIIKSGKEALVAGVFQILTEGSGEKFTARPFGNFLSKNKKMPDLIQDEQLNSSVKKAKTISELQLRPNPTIDRLEIQFELPLSKETKISIFSADGKLIEIIKNKKLDQGWHSLNYDANQLTSGNYFIKVETKDATQTKQFVKQ